VTIQPVMKITPQLQKPGIRPRQSQQLRITSPKTLQRPNRRHIQTPTYSDPRLDAQKVKAVINELNANHGNSKEMCENGQHCPSSCRDRQGLAFSFSPSRPEAKRPGLNSSKITPKRPSKSDVRTEGRGQNQS